MSYQDWLNYIIRRASTGADVVDPATGRRFPHTQPGVQGATRLKGAPVQPDPWAELVEQTGAIYDAGKQQAANAGRGTFDYLTKPQPVVNRDTGYVLRITDPKNPNWGKKREGALGEFTPGQRVAQAGAATAVVAPTAALVNREMDRRENQAMIDAALRRADGSISGEEYGGRYDQALRDGTISGEGYGDRYNRAMADGSITGETYGVGAMPRNVMPPRRPAEFTAARPAPMPPSRELQAQARAAQPSEGILSKIFSGQDYQSANALSSDPRTRGYSAPVVQDKRINWGDSDSAADFFRADKAMMAQRKGEEGFKSGGAANAKPDSVHKALEIIHHLLTRGH
jgi:hypothetical protein